VISLPGSTDHVGIKAAKPQPTGQPKLSRPLSYAPANRGLDGFVAPAIQKPQEHLWIGSDFRLAGEWRSAGGEVFASTIALNLVIDLRGHGASDKPANLEGYNSISRARNCVMIAPLAATDLGA
jgi:hypothetical protein